MRLRPETGRAERKVIESVLDGNMNVHDYIKINMSEGKSFYIINKRFWDQWQDYSQSDSKLLSNKRVIETRKSKESNFKLDNESLFKDKNVGSSLLPLRLNENCIVVPIRVWEALNSWYGPSERIRRTVI